MKITKAILPVAGLGTRFFPATKAVPKELLPVIDKPVIQYLVEEAAASGIQEIIFVISKEKRAIRKYFSNDKKLEATLKKRGKFTILKKIQALPRLANFVMSIKTNL